MSFQILCDSCCDFTATEKLSATFQKVPASVLVSGQTFRDDQAFQQAAFLDALTDKSIELKVLFPDERAWLEAFDPEAEEIYVVTSSAVLDDQYDTASRARRMFLQRHPGRQIHIFNTRSGSVGELLTARRIRTMERYGCTYRQIVERTEAEILSIGTWLLPASTDSLFQAGLLHKRPAVEWPHGIYRLTMEGTVARAATRPTELGAERKLIELLKTEKTAGKTCLISQCGNLERSRRIAALMRQNELFSEIVLLEAGAVMSLLLRRGGLAIAY